MNTTNTDSLENLEFIINFQGDIPNITNIESLSEKIVKYTESEPPGLHSVQGLLDTLEEVHIQCSRTQEFFKTDMPNSYSNLVQSFKQTLNDWKEFLSEISKNPKVIAWENRQSQIRLHEFKKSFKSIRSLVDDKLSEQCRQNPRYCFLLRKSLVNILNTKDGILKHISELYDSIAKCDINDKGEITSIYSREGEKVSLLATASIKDLDVQIRATLRASVKDFMSKGGEWDISQNISYPCQVIRLGFNCKWTSEIQKAVTEGKLADTLVKVKNGLDRLIKESLKSKQHEIRHKLIQLLINDHLLLVHQIQELIALKTESTHDYGWFRHMKFIYCQESGDVIVEIGPAKLHYGFDYVGIPAILTPHENTMRYYLSLATALSLNLAGCLSGPAGTGKTESIVQLAEVVGRSTVVFNCSDYINAQVLYKFLAGTIMSGAWLILDEFNRIGIEVIQNFAGLLTEIYQGKQSNDKEILFHNQKTTIAGGDGIFLTMNPGYKGRTELPDSLNPLIKNTLVEIPDQVSIIQGVLASLGFSDFEKEANYITNVLITSSQTLSFQAQYDYGLRKIKSIVHTAFQIREEDVGITENNAIKKSIRINVVSSLDYNDRTIFEKVLFPDLSGVIESKWSGKIKAQLEKSGIVEDLQEKMIEVQELISNRRHIILHGGGSEQQWTILNNLSKIQRQPVKIVHMKKTEGMKPDRFGGQKSCAELYGSYNEKGEWQDGEFPSAFRAAKHITDQDVWYVFDFNPTPIWGENINTLMDDNKVLVLNTGEKIPLQSHERIINLSTSLASASPAMISRFTVVALRESSDDDFLKKELQENISKLKEIAFDKLSDAAKTALGWLYLFHSTIIARGKYGQFRWNKREEGLPEKWKWSEFNTAFALIKDLKGTNSENYKNLIVESIYQGRTNIKSELCCLESICSKCSEVAVSFSCIDDAQKFAEKWNADESVKVLCLCSHGNCPEKNINK